MIQEISNVNSGLLSFSSESNIDSGDDVKQAFLALLQGLVGMVPHAPSAAGMIDVPRVAVEHQVNSSEQDSRKHSENTSQPQITENMDSRDASTSKSPVVSADKKEARSSEESGSEVRHNSEAASEKTLKTNDAPVVKQETVATKAHTEVIATSAVKSDSAPVINAEQLVESNVPAEVVREQKVAATQTVSVNKETRITKDSPVETVVDPVIGHEQLLNHDQTNLDNLGQIKADTTTVTTAVKSVKDLHVNPDAVVDEDMAAEESKLADEILGVLLGKSEIVAAKTPTTLLAAETRASVIDMKAHLAAPGLMAQAIEDSVVGKINSSSGTVEQMGLSLKDSSQRASGSQHAKATAAIAEPQQQKYIDKVKEVLERAALTKTMDSINVKIDPPHLGEITVRVVQKNGEIFARLIPESKEVEQTLKTKVGELAGVLQALGFKPEEVHVVIGKDPVDFSQFVSHQGQQGHRKEGNGFSQGSAKRKGFVDGGDGIENTIQSFPRGRLEEASGWVA